ncbi:phosphotransferase family enzyme [Blastococcus colisei]|uniref:Phosphotransferase family enzyme n=1 Tax=Blastococcus colisei TaxID=1564162 RepID=A0A543P1Q8_9ACTN|nr:phosphotransferase [Blastococcus colisei]TQN37900.1 phosphotransferase family enzyme [Blastococcus colisei]
MTAPDGLLDAVAAATAADGQAWFPDCGTPLSAVRLISAETRARCFLYRVELSSSDATRSIMVKVRHSDPNLRRLHLWEDRPVLAPVRTMDDESTARMEYQGLQLIEDALRDERDDRFGVLRPLAWLPGHAAMVTDLVEHPTLRTVLLGTTRLRLGARVRLGADPWRNAGAWLRLFHDHRSALPLTPRAETATHVGDLFRQFADFLLDRMPDRPLLRELSASGPDLAAWALPAELPLATCHGDFVANNMFTSPNGRITVFDPLPMWRAPVYQDIATLLVGLRALPVQAITQGMALPREAVARYEAAFLSGYFGTDPVPSTAVPAFQLLVLLDKWSALVSRRIRHGTVRPRVREARIRIASRHYHEETRRLLRTLERRHAAGGQGRGA